MDTQVVRIRVWAVAILLMPVLTFAQGPMSAASKPPASHVIVTPDQLVWKPLMPGSDVAVVSGDPDKKGGVYVLRIRTKGELKVPPCDRGTHYGTGGFLWDGTRRAVRCYQAERVEGRGTLYNACGVPPFWPSRSRECD